MDSSSDHPGGSSSNGGTGELPVLRYYNETNLIEGPGVVPQTPNVPYPETGASKSGMPLLTKLLLSSAGVVGGTLVADQIFNHSGDHQQDDGSQLPDPSIHNQAQDPIH